MARNYVYLGKRVKDVGKPGLDSVSEVKGIRDEIIKDRKAGRISARTAASRMNVLKLSVMRDRDFRGAKRRQAVKVVNTGIKRLKKVNAARKGRAGRARR